MDIGQLLRQARQEKGLSQRQLCGDVITRNMLSQIENGSARPSMDTLRCLAARLEKPMSYFLEEQAVSANQTVVLSAREAYARGEYRRSLELLETYQQPDEVFDPEKDLLEAMTLMALAEQALDTGKNIYAQSLLSQAAQAGEKTFYYTPQLERQRLLLCYRADPEQATELAGALPQIEPELILRAKAALLAGDGEKCVRLLTAEPVSTPEGQYLLGEGYRIKGEYTLAVQWYLKAEQAFPRETAARLEECFREVEDYKMAYFYACKLRENG